MKKIIFISFSFFSITQALGQVGINTDNPKSTLEVKGIPTELGKIDGFIIPRLKGIELKDKDSKYTNDQTGTIIYVTEALTLANTNDKTVNVTNIGYYYFDGTLWKYLEPQGPWYGASNNRPPITNSEGIIQRGKVFIGLNNFSSANYANYSMNINRDSYLHRFEDSPSLWAIRYNGTENDRTALRKDDVIGSIRFDGYNGSTLQNQAEISAIASRDFTTTNRGGADLTFYTQSGEENVISNSYTEKMRITALGNVGIGQPNPLSKLHIDGTLVFSGSQQQKLSIVNDTTPLSAIYTTRADNSGTGVYPFAGATNHIIIQPWSNQNESRDVVFMNNSTNEITMVVNRDNKVGIGITNPSEKLDVAGAITISTAYGSSTITHGAMTPVPTGGAGTLVFQNGHFFGYTSRGWRQLNNN